MTGREYQVFQDFIEELFSRGRRDLEASQMPGNASVKSQLETSSRVSLEIAKDLKNILRSLNRGNS